MNDRPEDVLEPLEEEGEALDPSRLIEVDLAPVLETAMVGRPVEADDPGRQVWVIPACHVEEGVYDAAYVLNPIDVAAVIEVMIFFADAPVSGPFEFEVPPCRMHRINLAGLLEEARFDTDYSVLIRSEVPVVVQHARIDGDNRIIATTMAFGH